MTWTFWNRLFPIFLLALMGCKEHKTAPKGALAAVDSVAENRAAFKWTKSFADCKTIEYKGQLALPDFTDNPFAKDAAYVAFITNGCKKQGVNFGGHYTILMKGCGTMCEHIFMIDRITGKVYTDIVSNDGKYGYLYKADSYLLVANANNFTDDSLQHYSTVFDKPELYLWRDSNFKRID